MDKNLKLIKSLLAFALVLAPLSVFAAFGEIQGMLQVIKDLIVKYLIPIVFSLALLYFFWGLAKYIRDTGEGKEEGRMIMVWGVVALFVMSTIWGLVKFIGDNLGIQPQNSANVPTITVP